MPRRRYKPEEIAATLGQVRPQRCARNGTDAAGRTFMPIFGTSANAVLTYFSSGGTSARCALRR